MPKNQKDKGKEKKSTKKSSGKSSKATALPADFEKTVKAASKLVKLYHAAANKDSTDKGSEITVVNPERVPAIYTTMFLAKTYQSQKKLLDTMQEGEAKEKLTQTVQSLEKALMGALVYAYKSSGKGYFKGTNLLSGALKSLHFFGDADKETSITGLGGSALHTAVKHNVPGFSKWFDASMANDPLIAYECLLVYRKCMANPKMSGENFDKVYDKVVLNVEGLLAELKEVTIPKLRRDAKSAGADEDDLKKLEKLHKPPKQDKDEDDEAEASSDNDAEASASSSLSNS